MTKDYTDFSSLIVLIVIKGQSLNFGLSLFS